MVRPTIKVLNEMSLDVPNYEDIEKKISCWDYIYILYMQKYTI